MPASMCHRMSWGSLGRGLGVTEGDQVREFEDKRWANRVQSPVWRHVTAAGMVVAEPVLDVGGGDGLLLRMLRERGFSDV
ncbi:MAG: hypothetical protein QOG88_442, partial [Actinomycetota bacterium]|nr:hypothetical protein [Actinomycetota bacterium]